MFVFFQMMVLLPFLILKIEESHFARLTNDPPWVKQLHDAYFSMSG